MMQGGEVTVEGSGVKRLEGAGLGFLQPPL